jgi:hypothetical protein
MGIATIDILAALSVIEWRSTRRVALLLPEPRGVRNVRAELAKLEQRGLVERRGVFPMWRKATARSPHA